MAKAIELKKNGLWYLGARVPISFSNQLKDYLKKYNQKNIPRLNMTTFIQKALSEYMENNPI